MHFHEFAIGCSPHDAGIRRVLLCPVAALRLAELWGLKVPVLLQAGQLQPPQPPPNAEDVLPSPSASHAGGAAANAAEGGPEGQQQAVADAEDSSSPGDPEDCGSSGACGTPRQSTGRAAAEAAPGGASPAALAPEAPPAGWQQEAPSPVHAAAAHSAGPTNDPASELAVKVAAEPPPADAGPPLAASAPTVATTTSASAGPAEAADVSESEAGAALGGPADAVLSRCGTTGPAEGPPAAPEAPAAAVAAGSARLAGAPAPCGSTAAPAQVPASTAALAACGPEKSTSQSQPVQPAALGTPLPGVIGQRPTGRQQPQQQAAQAAVSVQKTASHLVSTVPVAALDAPQPVRALAVQPADGRGSAGEQKKAPSDRDDAVLRQIFAPPADFMAMLEGAGLTRQAAVRQSAECHPAGGAAVAAPAPAAAATEAGGDSPGDDDLAVVLHADPGQQAAAAVLERKKAAVCRQQHQLLQQYLLQEQYLSQDALSPQRLLPAIPQTPHAPCTQQPLQGQTQLTADCGAAMALTKRARRKRRRSEQQTLQQQLQATSGALLQDNGKMRPPSLPLLLPLPRHQVQQRAAAPPQGTITNVGMGLPAAAQVPILNAMTCLS